MSVRDLTWKLNFSKINTTPILDANKLVSKLDKDIKKLTSSVTNLQKTFTSSFDGINREIQSASKSLTSFSKKINNLALAKGNVDALARSFSNLNKVASKEIVARVRTTKAGAGTATQALSETALRNVIQLPANIEDFRIKSLVPYIKPQTSLVPYITSRVRNARNKLEQALYGNKSTDIIELNKLNKARTSLVPYIKPQTSLVPIPKGELVPITIPKSILKLSDFIQKRTSMELLQNKMLESLRPTALVPYIKPQTSLVPMSYYKSIFEAQERTMSFSQKLSNMFNNVRKSISSAGQRIYSFGKMAIGSGIGESFISAGKGLYAFGGNVNKYVLSPLKSAYNTASRITGTLSRWGRMALIGGGIVAYGIYDAVKKSLSVAGNMEQAKVSFETILKDTKKGNELFEKLKTFAIKTPFTFQELMQNTQLGLAYGFKPEQMLNLLQITGDTATKYVKGAEGQKAIIRALGQIKQRGILSAEEANRQLVPQGVPAFKYVAEYLGKTQSEVMKMTKDRLIPSGIAINAILKGMRKNDMGNMIKQSTTFLGIWSNIVDVFDLYIFSSFGQGIIDKIKPELLSFVNIFAGGTDKAKTLDQALRKVGSTVGTYLVNSFKTAKRVVSSLLNDKQFMQLDFGGKLIYLLDKGLTKFDKWVTNNKVQITGTVKRIGDLFAEAFRTLIPTFSNIGVELGTSIIIGLVKSLPNIIKSIFDTLLKSSNNAVDSILGESTANIVRKITGINSKEGYGSLATSMVDISGAKGISIINDIIKYILKYSYSYNDKNYKENESQNAYVQSFKGYAKGTFSAPKGLSIVGEQGAELVNFRGGERVYNNAETKKMINKESTKNNITISPNINITISGNNTNGTTTANQIRDVIDKYFRDMAMGNGFILREN